MRLIAGPGGVYICDECVDLCREIIEEEATAPGAGEPPVVPDDSATSDVSRETPTVSGVSTLVARQHVLDLDDWTPDELRALLDRAATMRELLGRPGTRLKTLQGRVLVNLFYENSTRTRVSFELAGKKLGADVVNVTASASSVTKGESLRDTVETLQALGARIVVVRSSQSGAPDAIARAIRGGVVNAGDGWHAHPTQALLDLFTIREKKGRIAGLDVAIVGDILHSRVARSNLFGLCALGAKVRLVGPPTLLPAEFASFGVAIHHELKAGITGADVIMMLRIQRERQGANFFPSLDEYSRLFGLDRAALTAAKPDVVILHPGPMNRGVEISSEVADGPYSLILDQVTNGVAVRMALLYLLAARGRTEAERDAEERAAS
jgi:aspartate carbamoyltransferase catalytic subunit